MSVCDLPQRYEDVVEVPYESRANIAKKTFHTYLAQSPTFNKAWVTKLVGDWSKQIKQTCFIQRYTYP